MMMIIIIIIIIFFFFTFLGIFTFAIIFKCKYQFKNFNEKLNL